MKLNVIGSRSDGNAYVLQNAGVALLLEAGLPFKKTLEAINYELGNVVGCLVSHEHQDHANHVAEYLDNGIRVLASRGTCKGMQERWIPKKVMRAPEVVPYNEDGSFAQFSLGGFTVVPFDTIHSTEEPTGFYIHHADIGTMMFATDTGYLPRPFAGLNNLMIEANYDPDVLQARYLAGKMTERRYTHTVQGHMSIETTIDALRANDLTRVNNIILLHLSQENADPERFREQVYQATGKTVYVAQPGLEIEFNATPF